MGLEITHVEDDEILYRCIFFKDFSSNIKLDSTGRTIISGQAFSDRKKEPSVDRASLRDSPFDTQVESMDAVVELLCSEVREIDTVVKRDKKGNLIQKYKIDVLHRPINGNFSHAQIEPSPEYGEKGNTFKKLKIKLGLLATERLNQYGWAVAPKSII